MTLEEAVEILNKHQHRGTTAWTACIGVPGHSSEAYRSDEQEYEALKEFEAIAVAEKYEREAVLKTTE